MDAERRRLQRIDNLQNEGGEGYCVVDRYDADALNQALADEQTSFERLWTQEVTIARRAEWNTAVRQVNLTTDRLAIDKLAKSLGYSHLDIKRAMQLHGIK